MEKYYLPTNDYQYIQYFEWLDSVKTPLVTGSYTSKSVTIEQKGVWNFQVSGAESLDLRVQGALMVCDANGEELTDEEIQWVDLAVIDLGTLGKKTKITSDGIYSLGTEAVLKLRVKVVSVSGSVSIVSVGR